MDLSAWASHNQIALDQLEIHLLHWQELLLLREPLLVRFATALPLQASLRRHIDLSPLHADPARTTARPPGPTGGTTRQKAGLERLFHALHLRNVCSRMVSTFNQREPPPLQQSRGAILTDMRVIGQTA
jgi:hypothetical protein